MTLKLFSGLAKELKLKVKKWSLIPTYGEVAENKLVGGFFVPFASLLELKTKLNFEKLK